MAHANATERGMNVSMANMNATGDRVNVSMAHVNLSADRMHVSMANIHPIGDRVNVSMAHVNPSADRMHVSMANINPSADRVNVSMANLNPSADRVNVSMAHARAARQNNFTGRPSPYGSNVTVSRARSDAADSAAVISDSSYERCSWRSRISTRWPAGRRRQPRTRARPRRLRGCQVVAISSAKSSPSSVNGSFIPQTTG